MKKLTSLVLSGFLLSYSLTGCSSESTMLTQEIVPTQTQDVSTLSTSNSLGTDTDRTFSFIDANKDSKVSYTEFKKIIDVLAPSSTDKKKLNSRFESSFTSADANKDKMLSKSEFVDFGLAAQKLSGRISIAKNSTSTVAPNANNPTLIKQTFEILKGTDDKISEENFTRYMSPNPTAANSENIKKAFLDVDLDSDGKLNLNEFSRLFIIPTGKNSILDKTKSIVSIIPLLLFAPILWVVDKLGGFNNIK